MPANTIKCGGCGNEGEMETIGINARKDPGRLFRYLGNHEFTGNMYFLCPHCRREVVVNPMDVLEAPALVHAKSYLPPYASTEISHARRVPKRSYL